MYFDKRIVYRALASFKDRLNDFRTAKNEKLINYFQSIRQTDIEKGKIPERDEVANATGLTRTNVNKIMRELYESLIDSLSQKTWPIKKVRCQIWIAIPWHEMNQWHEKNKEHAEYLRNQSVIFECELPAIPRIGEEIRLDFIDGNAGFSHGYVSNVTHNINGDEQIINVDVHPIEKPYARWLKMKSEHEEEERSKRWLELEMERIKQQAESNSPSKTKKPSRK